MNRKTLLLATAAASLLAACSAWSPRGGGMGFFVTSGGSGRGGDLGGLAGADAHCQQLATAVGAGARRWHAYLSTQPSASQPQGGNARDRIGQGPWINAKGELIARNLAELHGDNRLTKQTALNERGEVINGRGDTPNVHDILTGSQPDGTFIAGPQNSTCANWTQGDLGSAMVGHHDRQGLNTSPPMLSWNSSHPSRGCSVPQLQASGGAGLFYCFAVD